MVREDVFHRLQGPFLLLAGPGTGKTYSLAKRIKFLVDEEQVSPENITVITFTNSAARNMHFRISDIRKSELYLPPEKQPRMICTMHSLGYRILKERASKLGLEDNIRVVYSDRLRNILVRDSAQLAGYRTEHAEEVSKCRQFGRCKLSNHRKCRICEKYQDILRSCSAIDYDDQILLSCKLLREDSELLKKYRSCCLHLLVDEYQDINASQFELINILSEGQREGLFVVGDDDQSIYSWRGGSPEFIRNFRSNFGEKARIAALNTSYRCHPHILEGAICIVHNNDKSRLPKETFEYKNQKGEKIKVHNVPSDNKEANIVKSIIERAIPSRSVLVLLPHRGFSAALVQELKKARIQYSAPLILPGEGLPIISTLSHWLNDSSDSLSFRECLEALINNPVFAIPSERSRRPEKLEKREAALAKVSNLWRHILEKKSDTLWDALKLESKNDELYSRTFAWLDNLRNLNDTKEDPSGFIAGVVKTLAPWKNTNSLLEEIDTWVESARQMDGAMQKPGVQIMTFQNSKGLEADIVCILGIEEGTLPRSDSSPEEIAEQSRLMFVSMTRAIEELHIFHARKRSGAILFRQVYNKNQPPDIHPSSFLNCIPKEHKDDQFHHA